MKCPECGYTPAYDDLPSCPQCGVDWRSGPRALDIAPPPPLELAESLAIKEGDEDESPWNFLSEERPPNTTAAETRAEWGGFWRRLLAFSIDVQVLSVLSAVLFYLCYVGYSVGLAAHGRSLTWEYVGFLVRFVLFVWFSLVAGYFVLFHGMEGRTIGKWVLGLRVVGAGGAPVSYGQAAIRWLGFIPSLISGLGILWILWNREKRSWHDRIARTWVIRDTE